MPGDAHHKPRDNGFCRSSGRGPSWGGAQRGGFGQFSEQLKGGISSDIYPRGHRKHAVFGLKFTFSLFVLFVGSGLGLLAQPSAFPGATNMTKS